MHVPMVVHWPAGIAADQRGTKRTQFINVSDVTPTVHELLGVTPPETYRGLDQLPITGNSFASMLADPEAPATNTLQYFENSGSRALVALLDDIWWKAVIRHIPGDDFDTEQWELFDLGADPSECNDLAGDQPERLTELIGLWWAEAERHGVLPLDDRGVALFAAPLRENSPHPPSRRYVYRPPMSRVPSVAASAAHGSTGRNRRTASRRRAGRRGRAAVHDADDLVVGLQYRPRLRVDGVRALRRLVPVRRNPA